jgi:hypothetical protein
VSSAIDRERIYQAKRAGSRNRLIGEQIPAERVDYQLEASEASEPGAPRGPFRRRFLDAGPRLDRRELRGPAPAMSDVDRYLEPIRVAEAFWQALADDDEDAMAPLMSPTWEGRPASGFAPAYRDARGLAAETCRFLGLASQAELVAPDRVRFRYSITDRVLYIEAATPVTVWRLELVEIDGRWFVDRSTGTPPMAMIDLRPLYSDLEPPTPGPIQ